ncbi:hypothetical protein ASG99_15810 [Bacillus sp. Soil768D1]|nr:hypothetical protein ASG99_15810 [Bacillus sp. Soil768D1]
MLSEDADTLVEQTGIHSLPNSSRSGCYPSANIRLEAAYLTLKAVQSSMMHNGSACYLKDSAPSRRFREAFWGIRKSM